jgi:basic amino acid/polyamine antiporter, APA family
MTHHSDPAMDAADAGFKKGLGLFSATMLVAGSMVGSGIFIVSADIARDVASAGWLLVVWLITAALTMLGALAYGELAAMMPHAGGQYVFLREAYGPLWGFLYGWTSFLVIQTGTIAAVGVGFAKYLGVVRPRLGMGPEATLYSKRLDWVLEIQLPWLDKPVQFIDYPEFKITNGHLIAAGIIAFLSLWNCLGVRQGSLLQNVFTVVKTATLLGLVVLGLTLAVNPAAIEFNLAHAWDGLPHTPRFLEAFRIVPIAWLAGAMVVSGAMVGSLFAADAWNNVTFIAGEVRSPERNLPRALALGTGGVLLLYLLANVAYLAALPVVRPFDDLDTPKAFHDGIANASNDRVATAMVETFWQNGGAQAMAIAIMISAFGCANGLILSGARLLYAMGRDGLFFRPVGTLNRRQVPAVGLVAQMLWTILLLFSGSYGDLLDYVIFAALLFYVLTVSALFVLRVRHPDWPRPYKALGYPILPALYVAAAAFIMLSLLVVRPKYSWPSFLIVLSGVPVYFLWRGLTRRVGGAEAQG